MTDSSELTSPIPSVWSTDPDEQAEAGYLQQLQRLPLPQLRAAWENLCEVVVEKYGHRDGYEAMSRLMGREISARSEGFRTQLVDRFLYLVRYSAIYPEVRPAFRALLEISGHQPDERLADDAPVWVDKRFRRLTKEMLEPRDEETDRERLKMLLDWLDESGEISVRLLRGFSPGTEVPAIYCEVSQPNRPDEIEFMMYEGKGFDVDGLFECIRAAMLALPEPDPAEPGTEPEPV